MADQSIGMLSGTAKGGGGSVGTPQEGVATVTNGRQFGRKSSTASLKSAWKIKYQDFLPVPPSGAWDRSEPFNKLVDKANDWLKSNSDVQVKTCETVTWMSHDKKWLGESEHMVLTKSVAENASTFFLRGLRIWLVPNTGQKFHSIAYTDFIPEGKDKIVDLLAKANKKFEHKQLKGRILTVETVGVPFIKGSINTTCTRWSESVETDSQSAFLLRIYTSKDSSHHAINHQHGSDKSKLVIDIKDIVPMPTDIGYEDFETLTDRANTWFKDQNDVIVTNMQSVMVQKFDGPHTDIGSHCYYTMPGINSMQPVEFFRILRIVFIQTTATGNTSFADIPIVYPFTYETFTPELVRQKETGCNQRERLEKMRETFSKVIAFLRNSGADVICAETVMNPMQMYIDESDSASLSSDDEIRFLLTIRLYLTGQISQLIDGSLRPVKRASFQLQQPGFESDPTSMAAITGTEKTNNASAPLFLRNVVGRQFKYRWLVLAISAFSCMAIIVVVSVVYSNR